MDIHCAGAYDDGSDGIAPVVNSFPARALRTLRFSSVTGAWTNAANADSAKLPVISRVFENDRPKLIAGH